MMHKLWTVIEEGGGGGCPMMIGSRKAGGISDISHVRLSISVSS